MRLAGPVGHVTGRFTVPPSKSLTNRALIAAAAAGGGQVVRPLDCDDTRVLARALTACGWALEWTDEGIELGRRRVPPGRSVALLGDSATGVRLVIALLAALPGKVTVDGSQRLRERPMRPLVEALERLGAGLESDDGGLPVDVVGRRLRGGRLRIRPEVSSQFVSALLLAAPLLEEGLELELEGPIPSRPYLDLTEEVLRAFGAELEHDRSGRRWRVAPGGLRPVRYVVDGDWSAAAFPLAAVAVAGGELEVGPLRPDSAQGDRCIVDVLAAAGLEVRAAGAELLAVRGRVRRPLVADLRDAPDCFPALAAVAAAAPPGSRLTGLENLRHKESDRLQAMVANLRTLGAEVEADGESFVVHKPLRRAGSGLVVTAAADHRVAMAMAVAALVAGPLTIDDPDCVAKSFPGFWAEWGRLVG